MEINVVIPSKWNSDQDPIEDIINLQKVFREEAKAPDRMILVISKEEAKKIDGLRSCEAIKVLAISGHPLIKALTHIGITGSIAGDALREVLAEALREEERAIQEASKAVSKFGNSLEGMSTFVEAVRSLNKCSQQRPENTKHTSYKPSQFPLKKNKKDIYKRL